jgi:Zn-dependent M16 (insulinase) family peptidase
MKASLIPGGHSFVSLRANRGYSRASAQEDDWFGIAQLRFLQDLTARIDEKLLRGLADLLKQIRATVFHRQELVMSLTMDESVMEKHSSEILTFWKNNLPDCPVEEPVLSNDMPRMTDVVFMEGQTAEGLAIPALIGFVGASLKGTKLGTEEHSAQILLSHLLKTGPLWEKIRMKGGAYGAFSSLSGLEETFSFATYRDPHIENSLIAFQESLEEFLSFDDSDELEKSLISVIGKELRPLSPSEKGIISLKRYLYAISDEIRQKKRDQLMDLTNREIRSAAASLLNTWEHAIIAVMAHPDHLDRASEQWPGLKNRRIDLSR